MNKQVEAVKQAYQDCFDMAVGTHISGEPNVARIDGGEWPWDKDWDIEPPCRLLMPLICQIRDRMFHLDVPSPVSN